MQGGGGESRPAVAEIAFPPGVSQASFVLRLPGAALASKVEVDFCEGAWRRARERGRGADLRRDAGHRKSVLPLRLTVEAGASLGGLVTVAAVPPGPARLVRGDKSVATAAARFDAFLATRLLRVTVHVASPVASEHFVFIKGAKVTRGPRWARGDEDGGEVRGSRGRWRAALTRC